MPVIVGPELLGAVVTGYEIDDALALDIKRFANCEVVFFATTENGYRETGSTLGDNTTAFKDWLAERVLAGDGRGRSSLPGRGDLSGRLRPAEHSRR